MSKKHVYVYSVDDVEYGGGYDCTEAERVGTAEDFRRARTAAAIAADELREKGNDADRLLIEREMLKVYSVLYASETQNTAGIHDALDYVIKCINNDMLIYWPYVQNRLLDFLEPVHFSSEYMEV